MDEEGTHSPPGRPQRLGLLTKIAYGTGHILNDMCASMWFTYLLIYFHSVLRFDNVLAGIIMLSGQIADGISTLFVGFFMDSGDNLWLCNKYGKRKSWHLIGTLCVLLSFPFIFMPCIGCSDADQTAQMVYFVAFVVIFQFGWAATQISHLSMIPVLTASEEERNSLTSRRYAGTVLSNTAVFSLTGALLGFGVSDSGGNLGPEDAHVFRDVALACVGAGGFMSLLFHFSVKIKEEEGIDSPPLITNEEINDSIEDAIDETDEPDTDHNPFPETVPVVYQRHVEPMKVLDWLAEPQFYQVAAIYMATRLFINISQAYIPLYVQHTLNLNPVNIAVIPLIMFISGFFVSLINKPLAKLIGRKSSMIMGCLIGLVGAVWVQFGSKDWYSFTTYQIYVIGVLVGAAGSQMLITSLCLVADLIANNLDSSAFVYGCMSLVDKFSNGLAIMAIQQSTPAPCGCPKEANFYKHAIVGACAAAAVMGFTATITLLPVTVGSRRRDRRQLRLLPETEANGAVTT